MNIQAKQPLIDYDLKYLHISDNRRVRSACRQWMNWRRDNLMPKKSQIMQVNRKGRLKRLPEERIVKVKSTQEQALEFHSSLYALDDLTQQIMNEQKHYLVGALAAEMRALVLPPIKPNSKYDPLLMRFARIGRLPLPVYILDPVDMASPPERGKIKVSENQPYPYRFSNHAKVVDLQEWLEDFALVSTSSKGRAFRLTNAELLENVSCKFGSSHYDQCATPLVAWLRSVVFDTQLEQQLLTHILFRTQYAIHTLGRWVLGRLHDSGVIDCSADTFPQWQLLQTRCISSPLDLPLPFQSRTTSRSPDVASA